MDPNNILSPGRYVFKEDRRHGGTRVPLKMVGAQHGN